MARRCELTGKGVQAGNNVSHSNIKSRRRFLPNVRYAKLASEALGRAIRFRVSAAGMRSVEHNNGLDNFLVKQPDARLSDNARRIKREIKKSLAARDAATEI